MRRWIQSAFVFSLLPLACKSGGTAGADNGRPQLEAHQVRAADGTALVYDVRGQGQPALVLIHCWCGNRAFWKNQVDELAVDHRVVTIDLPGHGESGRDRKHWTIEGLGEDVVRVADDLHLSRMILIGHSMGGPVALEAAARMPGRVDGIVAVDTLHDADKSFTREIAEQIATSYERDFAGTMQTFLPQMLRPDTDPAVQQWILDQSLKTDHTAAIALLRAFPDTDLKTLFRRAHTKVRAINSAHSAFPTNIETNRRYTDFDATILDDVGHYPHLEHPAEFNAALQQTLHELEHR